MKYLLVAFLIMGGIEKPGPDFTGDNLLVVLGEDATSQSFGQFKDFWLLDSKLSNADGGIKLIPNKATQKIDTILISGYGYTDKGVTYRTCTSRLPYGISLTDNVEALQQKTQTAAVKLNQHYVLATANGTLMVNYFSYGKIQWLKVFNAAAPVANAITETAKVPAAIPAKTTTSAGIKAPILQVFYSWRESSFQSLKSAQRTGSNFWNYKYTYSTKLKIPGEKFNMLYSFPFVNSPLDFVSVIKEADAYDSSFETTYKSFEKQLAESFTKAEGWQGVCLPNTDGGKLSDLEYRHDKLGSVVLDYSRNPRGGHVLYLRFIPYSN